MERSRLSDSESVARIRPMVWSRRWLGSLLLAAVVGAVLGVGAVGRLDPSFEATFGVLVGPLEADADLLEGSADLARTFGEVLESREIVDAAAREVGVSAGTVDVAATSARGSSLLDVRVRATTREVSQQLPTILFEKLEATIDAGIAPSDPTAASPNPPRVSGSTIVAIGVDQPSVTDQSISPMVGAMGGTASAVMLAIAFALAVDRRKCALDLVMDDFVDLGEVATVPAISVGRRRTRPRLVLGVDSTVAEFWELCVLPDSPPPVVLLLVPTGGPVNVDGALRFLASAESRRVRLIDADGLVEGRFRSKSGESHDVLELVARHRVLAQIDPKHGRTSSILTLASNATHDDVIVVIACLDAGRLAWRGWIDVADHVVVLASTGSDLARIRATVVEIRRRARGQVYRVSTWRRWIGRRSLPVSLRAVSVQSASQIEGATKHMQVAEPQ